MLPPAEVFALLRHGYSRGWGAFRNVRRCGRMVADAVLPGSPAYWFDHGVMRLREVPQSCSAKFPT